MIPDIVYIAIWWHNGTLHDFLTLLKLILMDKTSFYKLELIVFSI